MTVSIKDIDHTNWLACIRLKVAEHQSGYVATNAKSLAQAAYQTDGHHNWTPKGIYDDNEMVGFALYGRGEFEGRKVWAIMRLMVDEKHQNKGYGKAAMALILADIRNTPDDTDDLYISFVPENTTAKHIYENLGFADVGFTPDGSEVLMHMKIER